MKENTHLQNFKKEIQKSDYWHPNLDVELKNCFDIITTKNVVTFESMVLTLIGQDDVWTIEAFEKYYTFLESLKTHINNLIAIISSKNHNNLTKTLKIDSIGFMEKWITVKNVAKKSNILIFVFDELTSKFPVNIFDIFVEDKVITKNFIERIKSIVISELDAGKYINVLDAFIIGLNDKNALSIFNTPNGIVQIMNNLKKDLELADIPLEYIKPV